LFVAKEGRLKNEDKSEMQGMRQAVVGIVGKGGEIHHEHS